MQTEPNAQEFPALRDELCSLCEHNADYAVYRCHKCAKLYCLTHASEIDPCHHCINCLKVEDASVEEAPLVDAEGIRHAGRILRPVGNAFTQQNKLIMDMEEAELIEYIKQYKVLLSHYEQVTNAVRINLTQATHEAFDRQIAKLEKIGGEIVFTNNRKPHVVKESKTRLSAVDSIAAKLGKAGVTPEMLARLIALAKAKKVV